MFGFTAAIYSFLKLSFPPPPKSLQCSTNCFSLLPKRGLHFFTSGIQPAMFLCLPCPFQTPCPSETSPVSISVLSFPNPSLAPPLQRKGFSSPGSCWLAAAGERTPGFVLNVRPAAALCRSTRSACMQLLAERLREDSVFLCHLHARCTLSHPSFQHASRFSPLDLTPSHRLFSSTFLVYLTIELHKEVFPKAHVQLAMGLTSPCHGVFLESLCHLPHTYQLQ